MQVNVKASKYTNNLASAIVTFVYTNLRSRTNFIIYSKAGICGLHNILARNGESVGNCGQEL